MSDKEFAEHVLLVAENERLKTRLERIEQAAKPILDMCIHLGLTLSPESAAGKLAAALEGDADMTNQERMRQPYTEWKCQQCGCTFRRYSNGEPRKCQHCGHRGVKTMVAFFGSMKP